MSTGVMIAYIPTETEWCRQDLPHMTLVYCGSIQDLPLQAFNAIAKDAITAARISGPLMLDVTGVEVFGEAPETVDVLTLQSVPKLDAARKAVEKWNASEYTTYSPHCTVGPEGSAQGVLPTRLYFDRLMVTWGNRQMSFRLSN
jgi:2'-5' RNA ligase